MPNTFIIVKVAAGVFYHEKAFSVNVKYLRTSASSSTNYGFSYYTNM